MKYWHSLIPSIGTLGGHNNLKQEELSSHKYCLSWETIRIPHWDWKSDSPLCGEGGEVGTEVTRAHC